MSVIYMSAHVQDMHRERAYEHDVVHMCHDMCMFTPIAHCHWHRAIAHDSQKSRMRHVRAGVQTF